MIQSRNGFYKLLLISAQLVFVIVAISTLNSSNWNNFWRRAGVTTLQYPFTDLRSTPAAVDAMRHGSDPYLSNPGDPLKRPFNYPPIWIALFSAAGITQDRVPIVAVLFICLFSLTITIWAWRAQSVLETALIIAGAFSYGARLAMERANTDLFIFFLLSIALQLSNTAGLCALMLVAAILKIYPVFGLVALLFFVSERRVVGLTIIGFAIYCLCQLTILAHIRANTPVFVDTYGVPSMAGLFAAPDKTGSFLLIALTIFSVCFLVAAWSGYLWARRNHVSSVLSQRAFIAYFVFGSVYVGTYLFNSNFDYRLIFLIPTLLLYCELWLKRATRVAGGVGLILTFAAMNLGLGLKSSMMMVLLPFVLRPAMAVVICFYMGAILKWKSPVPSKG